MPKTPPKSGGPYSTLKAHIAQEHKRSLREEQLEHIEKIVKSTILRFNDPRTTDRYTLFNYLLSEAGLILVDTELETIEALASQVQH